MNLISKKDLLAITGISYGQLYRWKRERLIPEEWFIKQSAYTGQETFFPRDQILSRIHSILDLKDTYSLEELAKMLSPEAAVAKVAWKDLSEISEIDKAVVNILPEILGTDQYEFYEIAMAIVVSKAYKELGLSEEEAAKLLRISIMTDSIQKSANVSCIVFYTGKEYHTAFIPNAAPITFDSSIEIKLQLSISEITDTVKVKYKYLFMK